MFAPHDKFDRCGTVGLKCGITAPAQNRQNWQCWIKICP